MSSTTEYDLRLADAIDKWADLRGPKAAAIFGYPVIIDPQLPAGEIHLRSESETIKIVNVS